MKDQERDALRAQVKADTQKMADAMAHLYIGRTCPVTQEECKGPFCPWFLPTGEDGKITGGACSVPLIASKLPDLINLMGIGADALQKSVPAPKLVTQ